MWSIRMDRGITKDILGRAANGLLAVFMTERSHMVTNVGSSLFLESEDAANL